MSLDVEIYMNGLIKFFKQNPNDLLNLIPQDREEEFYSMIKEVAQNNIDKGEEATLTHIQLIDICRKLNAKNLEKKSEFSKILSQFGPICLN